MAPQGGHSRRRNAVAGLSPVLVLDTAVEAAAGDLHVDPRGQDGGSHTRFAVEMTGDAFADPQKAAAATADIQANPGKIVSVRLYPYKDRQSVRVVFDLDPGSETYSELRLTLNVDKQAVSETWLYRWTA